MATSTMNKDSLRDLVEDHLRSERSEGRDPSPSEIYDAFAPKHPEIAKLSKPQFSGGIVRVVKQKLNREGTKTVSSSKRRSRVNSRRKETPETPTKTNGTGNGTGTTVSVDREGLRIALFDFASEFVHAESASDRISKLQDIDNYVQRVSDLIECHEA